MLKTDNEGQKEKILELLANESYRPMKAKEMTMLMQVPEKEVYIFYQLLNELEQDGRILITQKGKLMLPEKLNTFKGVFHGNAKGFGFVRVDGEEDDVFIPAHLVKGAINKDEVLFRVLERQENGRRAEGEIIRVIKRGYSEIIGTFEKERNFGFVIPDDKKIPGDVYVSLKNSMGAVTGHKVAVKLIKEASEERKAEGKIIDIIGHINDPGVDITSIVRQFEIPFEFSEKVHKELKSVKDTVEEDEITGRKDLRDTLTITIDGEDTKDLDDAISISALPGGGYVLGVHIADVTHYVKENSEIDKEALKRGTSVYLLDRVIPMLPHVLSNGICSLNPNEDRLTLSCIMKIDAEGNVSSHEIQNTVINVNKRMTYTIVNDILVNGENSEYFKENEQIYSMLREMESLAGILREKRVKQGAIQFDFPEAKIIVDENGKPVEIKAYDRNIATSIIEEFMLAANKTVAEEYFWLEMPFVFRTHEVPDSEKMLTLSAFVQNFGYSFRSFGTMHPGTIQALLSKIESTPEETVISRVVLRSLKQARYTPENLGHFGLAAKYYCHFTSPIRRYPDLQIHRIIKEHIKGDRDEYIEHLKRIIPDVCVQCSKTERTAEMCEREVENLKKVEFMADKVGQEFDGIISGVTGWGIYVELPNTVEGMVSLASMDDDYYVFDKQKFMYVGERFKKTYSLGDKVRVVLNKANTAERTLDFEFAPGVEI